MMIIYFDRGNLIQKFLGNLGVYTNDNHNSLRFIKNMKQSIQKCGGIVLVSFFNIHLQILTHFLPFPLFCCRRDLGCLFAATGFLISAPAPLPAPFLALFRDPVLAPFSAPVPDPTFLAPFSAPVLDPPVLEPFSASVPDPPVLAPFSAPVPDPPVVAPFSAPIPDPPVLAPFSAPVPDPPVLAPFLAPVPDPLVLALFSAPAPDPPVLTPFSAPVPDPPHTVCFCNLLCQIFTFWRVKSKAVNIYKTYRLNGTSK